MDYNLDMALEQHPHTGMSLVEFRRHLQRQETAAAAPEAVQASTETGVDKNALRERMKKVSSAEVFQNFDEMAGAAGKIVETTDDLLK